MSHTELTFESNAKELFKQRYRNECAKVTRFMVWLMVIQWIAGILFAAFYSPLTWIGEQYAIHTHIWIAVLLGGAISGFAILWAHWHRDAASTRHVMAISQVLWSALLIHLTGGRIETHFHVFASLAILSIYRDWKILVTATAVVAIDHFFRGIFYPLSAFGIVTESPLRWIEHAAWVLFEVAFLAPGCAMLRNEIYELCLRQSEIEQAKRTVDEKVKQATSDLLLSNELLAEQTKESEKLALVAKFTDNAVIITDDEGRIEWVNEGFERITGYSLSESIGQRPVDLLNGPGTDPETIEAVHNAIRNREDYDFEMLRYRKDGQPIWMAIEARTIRDEHGNPSRFILVESDITERVKAEIERQRLNDQLIEASRAAGLAEAATGVLHNVGNVLNSVNVSASLIEGQIRKSAFDKLERVANLIEENSKNFGGFVSNDSRGQKIPSYITKVTSALKTERASISNEFKDMVNNIEHIKEIVSLQQNVAKTSALIQEIDVAAVVDQAIAVNKGSLYNHRVAVQTHIDEFLPEIKSDKHKLLQILINLIKNAKDAVSKAEIDDARMDIFVSSCEDGVVIEVADNGVGIAAEDLDKIFQHGFTTKSTGHGFGLHSCANFAGELGGSLCVSSDGLGCGAKFRLVIPLISGSSTVDKKSPLLPGAGFEGYIENSTENA